LDWPRPTSGFCRFRFWEDIYRKNDIVCQQKRKLLSIGFLWTKVIHAKSEVQKMFSTFQKKFFVQIRPHMNFKSCYHPMMKFE